MKKNEMTNSSILKLLKLFKALQLPWMLLDLWKCSQCFQRKCDLNFFFHLETLLMVLFLSYATWLQLDHRNEVKLHEESFPRPTIFLGNFMKWTPWNLFIRGERSFEEEDGYWKTNWNWNLILKDMVLNHCTINFHQG